MRLVDQLQPTDAIRRTRHQAMRQCVGCGERAPQTTMIRLKLDPLGKLAVGQPAGGGRSGYLHHAEPCWQRFAERKGPLRSLARSFDRDARRAFITQLKESDGNIPCGFGSR